MKKILNKFFLVTTSLIITLFLIEWGFGIYVHMIGFSYVTAARSIINYDRLPEGLFVESRDGWGLNPNFSTVAITSDFQVAYDVNNYGFRGEDLDLNDKKEGVISVVALGDSFTFGEGVPLKDTYVGKLDDSLTDADVYNLGVPGQSLDAAVNIYSRYEQILNPDIAILFLNELMIRRTHWLLSPDGAIDHISSDQETIYLSRDNSRLLLPEIKLLGNSELYQFFQYKFSLYFLTENLYQKDNKIWDQVRKWNQLAEEEKQSSQTIQELDDVLLRYLVKLKDESEERGDLLVIVNIDVNPVTQKDLKSELGLNYVDLSKEISAYQANVGPVRFDIDRHYNPMAHQLIYELLQPRIKEAVELISVSSGD